MNFCKLKSCKYYGKEEELDCILRYIESTQEGINKSKQALDSSQKSLNFIIEHYKALTKPKNPKPLYERNDETIKYQEREKELKRKLNDQKLPNPFLWAKARKLSKESNSELSSSASSSPENTLCKKLLELKTIAKVKPGIEKESYEEDEVSINKENSKLSEIKKGSPLKNGQNNTISKLWPTSVRPKLILKTPQIDSQNDKDSRVSVNNSSNHNNAILEESQNSFSFSQSVNDLENELLGLIDESMKSPEIKNKKEEDDQKIKKSTPIIPADAIKKEKILQDESIISSPDIFSSDIILVEPEEKIYTIEDFTQNPVVEEAKAIAAIPWQRDRYLDKFIDSMSPIQKQDSFQFTKREHFEGECMDCELFYDDVCEKKCAEEANLLLRHCSNNCQGYQERCKKLKKENEVMEQTDQKEEQKEPKNFAPIIRVRLDELRKRRAKGLQDDEIDPNATPHGFWEIDIAPRRRSPVRKPVKNPWLNTQEIKELESILKD